MGGLGSIRTAPGVYREGMRPRPLQILLVDDNPTDVLLTEEALRVASWPSDLRYVHDGQQALSYLRGEGEHAGEPRPDIVWLDLNLPGMDGHAILRAIREDPSLSKIPVMILSTSSDPHDVNQAYAHHANCYSVKEVDFSAFADALADIVAFWGKRVSLPS